MAPKKDIDWVAIKKRYLKGEKPKAIAPDFGLTANQVSEKARRDNWKSKKTKIAQKVEEIIETEILSLKDRVLAEYEALAFSRMNRFQDWEARGMKLKKSSELSDSDAACVAEVSQTKDGMKLKLHNKLKALDALAEHLGILKPKTTINIDAGTPGKDSIDPLIEALGPVAQEDWADHIAPSKPESDSDDPEDQ